jgi:hypothetical protein
VGITQQLGASSLIKPGVIDNTAARPASPFEGQVIFQKDTDQLLVWNGTAWVIPNSPAQNPQGLELITPTSVTNGTVTTGQGTVRVAGTATSVTINGVFSSAYESYLMVSRLSWASGGGDVGIQLCIAGTPTAGTAYNWSMMQAYSGAGVSTTRTSATSSVTFMSNANGVFQGATTEIMAPQLATPTMFVTQNLRNDGAYGTPANYLFYGNCSDSLQYDGIKIFEVNGVKNITGTISIYGRRL